MIKTIVLTCSLMFFSTTTYSKKIKTPKTRLINEFQDVRKKNAKKIKRNVDATLNFRSVDFVGEYYIGGKVQEYVEKMVYNLLDGFEDESFKKVIDKLKKEIKVYVVYDRTLNAHSTRSNNIVLTSQWVIDANNEGEVVSVLAHELAHIILRHPDTNVSRNQQTKSLEKFTQIATIVTFLSGTRVKSVNNKLVSTQTKSSEDEVLKAVLLGSMMKDVKMHYINTRVSRKNEEQADYLGIDMIDQSGYPVESEITMLKILKADEEKTTETITKAESFLDLVQPTMQKWASSELDQLAGDNILKKIFANIIKQNIGKFTRSVGTWIRDKRRTHLKATIRYDKVDAYINYFELNEGKPSLKKSMFKEIKNTVNTVYSSFQQVELANYMIDLGSRYFNKADKILKTVNQSIKRKDRQLYQPVDVMQWVIRSRLRIAQRRFEDASQNICKFIMHFPSEKNCAGNNFIEQAQKNNFFIPQEVFILLAESYIHKDKLEQAKSIIEQGTDYYTDDQPFQLHKVMIACKEKELKPFQKALKQCKLSSDFGSEVNCNVIDNNLKALKEKASEQLKKDNPFLKIKDENIEWWQTCSAIKTLPFSSVKTNVQRQEIIELANELINKINKTKESPKENSE